MRRVSILAVAGLLAGVLAAAAAAVSPHSFDYPLGFQFPDYGNGVVVFVNSDRASYCTPEVVQSENDFIAWLEGGMVGDPPDPPLGTLTGFPDGLEPVRFQAKETGKGALVYSVNEDDLYIELWEMDDNPGNVGPCLDTDGTEASLASGTTTYQAQDNDLFGTGTRGNAFGNRGRAELGGGGSYTWRFHVNSRCYAPEEGPPACLLDVGELVLP